MAFDLCFITTRTKDVYFGVKRNERMQMNTLAQLINGS